MADRNVRFLENRFDRDRELLPAFLCFALVHAGPACLAGQLGYFLAAAVRANRAFRPADFLKVLAGLIFGQLADLVELHGECSSLGYSHCSRPSWFDKYIIPKN